MKQLSTKIIGSSFNVFNIFYLIFLNIVLGITSESQYTIVVLVFSEIVNIRPQWND